MEGQGPLRGKTPPEKYPYILGPNPSLRKELKKPQEAREKTNQGL